MEAIFPGVLRVQVQLEFFLPSGTFPSVPAHPELPFQNYCSENLHHNNGLIWVIYLLGFLSKPNHKAL